MPDDKKNPAKKQPTMRERVEAWYTETSRRLNPSTYVKPKAQETMRNANENYGGGARRRHIDAQVEKAVGEREPRRDNRR